MSSDPRLDVALTILRDAGHQIGDTYFAPDEGGTLKIWIDGVPCTLRGVFRMAEEEIEAKDKEKPESPG